MPVQVTYPGVYIQEAPSGVHAISGVATSVAAFVGMCPAGPVNVPTRTFSFREYDALFGGSAPVGEMTDQVRQFFMNGGGTAWIVRNARGVTDGSTLSAQSTLLAEDATPVLRLVARDAGSVGNQVRVEIDYATASPERTFNLIAYRHVLQSDGSLKRMNEAKLQDLSMDPTSPRYAVTVVNEQSELLRAQLPGAALTPSAGNISQSALIFNDIGAFFAGSMGGTDPLRIMVSVAGSAPVPVDLSGITGATAAVLTDMESRINGMLGTVGAGSVTVTETAAAGGSVLRISSTAGAVVITSSPADDAAQRLGLGVVNGGLETDGYAGLRPAATGFLSRVHGNAAAALFDRIHRLADTNLVDFPRWEIVGSGNAAAPPADVFGGAGTFATAAGLPAGVIGRMSAVAERLDTLVASINVVAKDVYAAYRAGLRIGIRPLYGNQDSDLALAFTSSAASIYQAAANNEIAQTGRRPTNVVSYGIGLVLPAAPAAPGGAYRASSQAGSDGEPPLPDDYEYSWNQLERIADIFNLMVLPRATGTTIRQSDGDRAAVWGPASAFCRERRAFLIIDPPSDPAPPLPATGWSNANAAAAGIVGMRSGIVTDHAAIYWPRIVASDSKGKPIPLDPAGTMAGVYAKTDVKRGIWKAPAGLEATLVGVRALEIAVTNAENGVTNPQAINTLRTMSSGATSWGARTMMGYDSASDQDYRYIPVRRLALYIEESLFRGLQWAVFEPNGEVLWGQIRLAAGAFMNGLFRQGAFKGLKSSDAYFVACGPTTTTQTDINLGIVNVEVGFAPLRPAEFVVVTIRQMVGQIEV